MRGHHVCAWMLVAHGAAFAPGSGLRISSAPGRGRGPSQARTPVPIAAPLALRCELNKIEASAVQRMTKGYDKLCKNCPTRLQPRVDTLTEMILGLPAGERDALLQAVAQRTEALVGDDSGVKIGVATPRELYDFQLTGQTGSAAACVVAGAGLTPPMTETSCRPMEMDAPSEMKMEKKENMPMGEGGDKMRMKLMEKMEKYREKIGENEMKLARAGRMLAVADILIAQGASAQVPESAVDATDMEIAEDIAELRMMSPEGLKVKRLKYLEKQAKYTRKVAECKMDLLEKTQEYEAMAQQSALAC